MENEKLSFKEINYLWHQYSDNLETIADLHYKNMQIMSKINKWEKE